jgi:SAM-dependent methyltransferase
MMDRDNIALQWDCNAANWSLSLQQGHDLINEQFGIPFFLDQLGNIDGLEVLDAGCGEGRSSRHIAAKGARVTGVDLSPGMIAEASRKEIDTPLGIRYAVSSCADLGAYREERFHLVTSFMALMDTAHLALVLREFFRVLKVGGKLMIAVRHPCFFTPGFSLYSNSSEARAELTVSKYFVGKPYSEQLKFSQQQGCFTVTRYPYTMTDYADAILGSGLTLTALNEPRPTEEMCQQLPNLRFWQMHAALYLFIQAEKFN